MSVYVASDPPVLVPFVVAIYCRLFDAQYVYHLQDIHPEAANIVVPLNGLVMKLLLAIDNYILRHAKALVTLSEDMKSHLLVRYEDNLDDDKKSFIVNNRVLYSQYKI